MTVQVHGYLEEGGLIQPSTIKWPFSFGPAAGMQISFSDRDGMQISGEIKTVQADVILESVMLFVVGRSGGF